MANYKSKYKAECKGMGGNFSSQQKFTFKKERSYTQESEKLFSVCFPLSLYSLC